MDEVASGLFISSLEVARDLVLLRERSISAIVCIGCEPLYPDQFEYCSFPGLLDVPETSIMKAIPESCAFLSRILNSGSKALVHCVYGQSRSAALIAAHLVSHSGLTLEEALTTLKRAHPSVCINPGFLSQLHLYCHSRKYFVEYSLACGTADREEANSDVLEESERNVCCRSCGAILCSTKFLLQPRDTEEFLARYTDEFWKGYRSPLASDSVAKPGDPGLLLFAKWTTEGKRSSLIKEPAAAKRKRARGASAIVKCARCHEQVGHFQENGLAICSGFALRDLHALFEDKTRISPLSS
jgi:hypothetical protein